MKHHNADMYIRQYKKHTKYINGSHAIFNGRYHADIFSGFGWKCHSVYKMRNGVWCHISGPILKDVYVHL